MTYDIYAYWNTVELSAVFNAIAALIGSNSFGGMLKTIAMIAIMSMAISVLAVGRGSEDFARWVVIVAVLNGLLLVPKTTVHIVDRTGSAAPQVVDNVPVGLAVLAHTASKIGDWLTVSYESLFSLPDDVQLRKSGMMFGHRVQKELLAANPRNAVLANNLVEFFRECVWPDVAAGIISPETVASSSNIWGEFSGVNPGLMVELTDYATGASLGAMGCVDAYNALNGQLTTDSDKFAIEIGRKNNPTVSEAEAKALFLGSLQTTTGYLLGVSQSAPDLIKNAIVGNAFIDAQYKVPAQLGDAATAQVALANAQAIRSFTTSTATQVAMAESMMPKLRNAAELLIYSIFPLFVTITVIAGHKGLMFVRMYFGSLIWVQLWAPLYAVVNFMMNVKASSTMTAATAANGTALRYYNYVGDAVVSDQAVAGVLAIAIPAIAWGIVQGINAIANSIGGALGTGATQGAGVSQGNVSMGNTSLQTSRANVHASNSINAQPTMTTGAPVTQDQDSSGIKQTGHADGSKYRDASNNVDKGAGFSVDISQGMSAGKMKAAGKLDSVAANSTESAARSTAAAMTRFAEFGRDLSNGAQSGHDWSAGTDGQIVDAAKRNYQAQHAVEDAFKLSNSRAAQVVSELGGGLDLGVVKAKLAAQGSLTAKQERALNNAHKYATSGDYSHDVAMAQKASENAKFGTFTKGGESGRDGMKADLAEAQRYENQAALAKGKARSLREEASLAKEGKVAFSENDMRGWMQFGQRFGYSNNEMLMLYQKDNATYQDMKRDYIAEKIQQFTDLPALDDKKGWEKLQNEQQQWGNEQKKGLHIDPNGPNSFHSKNAANVHGEQSKSGVVPGTPVDNSAMSAAGQTLSLADLQRRGMAMKVNADSAFGKNIEKLTSEEQSMVLGVLSMAGNEVTNAGMTFLREKHGLVPDSDLMSKQVAADYAAKGGDEASAWKETAVFVGTAAIGGPAGSKVLGAAATKLMRAEATAMAGAGEAGAAKAAEAATARAARVTAGWENVGGAAGGAAAGKVAAEAAAGPPPR